MAPRREQERSKVTRTKLIEAALGCLADKGWSGTTMEVVAKRAGVSRGAAQHHFRTRGDLVTAAVVHVSQERMAQVRERAAELPKGSERFEATLTMLAGFYTSEAFTAALHLWVAAVSDARLRKQLVPLEAHVGREVHTLTVELLGVDEKRPNVREMVQATLDLIRGLALANLLSDDGARRGRILKSWAQQLRRLR